MTLRRFQIIAVSILFVSIASFYIFAQSHPFNRYVFAIKVLPHKMERMFSTYTTASYTFYYQGPPFDIQECINAGGPVAACQKGSAAGSISGWVTLTLPANYTGPADITDATAWKFAATNIAVITSSDPTLDPGAYMSFQFVSGNIVEWSFDVQDDFSMTSFNLIRSYWETACPPTVCLDHATVWPDFVWAHQTTIGFRFIYNPPIGRWTTYPLPPLVATKTLGPACAVPGGTGCGDPINVGTGNVSESMQDYSTVGQNPLAFARYYNSFGVDGTYAVSMGINWRHIFDRYLHIISTSTVTAERADGQGITFTSSGTWSPNSDMDYSLSKSGSTCSPSPTWKLTDPDDTVETYCQSGTQATLQSIQLRNGYTQTMHYTGGKLTSVTDTYGRGLGMTYTGTLLTGLTTPDSLSLTYGYVAFSSANQLATVTYNTSPATHQTYLYENTSYPFALTGITDENGHRYATWGYDTYGRAVLNQLAGGVNYTSVSYFDDTGNRAVKGPLGIVETYKFSTLQEVPKVACGSRPCVSPPPRVRLRLSPPRQLRPPPQAPVWPRGFWPSASACRRSSRAFRRRDGLRRAVCPLARRLLPQLQASDPLRREAPSRASSCGRNSSPCVWRRSP
jgi:hypothetical protein